MQFWWLKNKLTLDLMNFKFEPTRESEILIRTCPKDKDLIKIPGIGWIIYPAKGKPKAFTLIVNGAIT